MVPAISLHLTIDFTPNICYKLYKQYNILIFAINCIIPSRKGKKLMKKHYSLYIEVYIHRCQFGYFFFFFLHFW